MLGVSNKTIRNMIKRGDIQSIRLASHSIAPVRITSDCYGLTSDYNSCISNSRPFRLLGKWRKVKIGSPYRTIIELRFSRR